MNFNSMIYMNQSLALNGSIMRVISQADNRRRDRRAVRLALLSGRLGGEVVEFERAFRCPGAPPE